MTAARHDRTTALVHAAKDGARSALEDLVIRLSPWLLAQARYRLRGELAHLADAEDLVHETWLVVLPRLRDLVPRAGRLTPVLMQFLATTLRRRVRTLLEQALRGKAGLVESPSAGGPFAETVDHVSRHAAARERAERIQAALLQLGDRDRALVILRGIEQTPYAEIAVVLGIEANTAMVAFRRACRRLARLLPAEWARGRFD